MLKYWMYLIHHNDENEPSITSVNEYFCKREGNYYFGTIMFNYKCSRVQDSTVDIPSID